MHVKHLFLLSSTLLLEMKGVKCLEYWTMECCFNYFFGLIVVSGATEVLSSLSCEYVASGSDDGRWCIWERRTERLIKMLLGDDAVVNCVQCHPFDCFVTTSGIDSTIKLWTPTTVVAMFLI
ncbi:hypothetical protein REPUB_Repub18cG0015300 [Reevesia pubescens]